MKKLLFSTACALACFFAQAASVTVSWLANTDPTATGYVVYYGASPNTYTNSIDFGASRTNIISGLNSNVTYYFNVTAYNGIKVESDFSQETPFTFTAVTNVPTPLNLRRVGN